MKKFIFALTGSVLLWSVYHNRAFCAPIVWHGDFGVDTTRINSYRYTSNEVAPPTPNSSELGSQLIPGGDGNAENAAWQSYLFKMQPTIVINDTATLHGEISSGYGRGGFLGDDSTKQGVSDSLGYESFGNALYYHNTTDGTPITINQLYMNLFTQDVGTFTFGRIPLNWGLGAVYNNGDELWDRHFSSGDGLKIQFKLGNFYFTPYWTKLSNGGTQVNNDDAKDYGISVLYDNVDKDLAFGVLYSIRSASGRNNTYATSDIDGDGNKDLLGGSDVKMWNLYFHKYWKKFSLAGEFAFISGELSNLFQNNDVVDYSANTLVVETAYKFSDQWQIGLDFGRATGENSSQNEYSAMYLHPNYQVAYMLFHYNLRAMTNENANIFDSYIHNATYLKLYSKFRGEKWDFYGGIIYAMAQETAQAGTTSYNHSTNTIFTAQETQDDSLGTEIDLGMDYHWNTSVTIGLKGAYLMPGDYFAFDNDPATKPDLDSSFLLNANVAVRF